MGRFRRGDIVLINSEENKYIGEIHRVVKDIVNEEEMVIYLFDTNSDLRFLVGGKMWIDITGDKDIEMVAPNILGRI